MRAPTPSPRMRRPRWSSACPRKRLPGALSTRSCRLACWLRKSPAPAEVSVPTRPPAKRIFLVQGDIYCGAEQAVVSTILGSCVSVCLWDQGLKLGGINHYVLPVTQSTSEPENTRYGDVAIDYLYRMMLNLGGRPNKLQAKIFG